jgi:hypothetical protein
MTRSALLYILRTPLCQGEIRILVIRKATTGKSLTQSSRRCRAQRTQRVNATQFWARSLSHGMQNRAYPLGQSRQGRKNVAHCVSGGYIVRAEVQAPTGRHRTNQMCRPVGAVNHYTACPTVSTVGYAVTSLRDFEQHKGRTPHISNGRNFLGDRLLCNGF